MLSRGHFAAGYCDYSTARTRGSESRDSCGLASPASGDEVTNHKEISSRSSDAQRNRCEPIGGQRVSSRIQTKTMMPEGQPLRRPCARICGEGFVPPTCHNRKAATTRWWEQASGTITYVVLRALGTHGGPWSNVRQVPACEQVLSSSISVPPIQRSVTGPHARRVRLGLVLPIHHPEAAGR